MCVRRAAFLVLFCLSYCHCGSFRIWHNRNSCIRNDGFTCLPRTGEKKTVIVECPLRTREYHIYINEFNGPRTLENLIVRNCKTLTVLFRCSRASWEKKNLKYVEVSNIETLKIQNVAKYQSVLPPKVVLKNIGNINNIPSDTFSQIRRDSNRARCHLPHYKFSTLDIHNVSIDTMQIRAIDMANDFLNVTFSHVRIKNFHTGSIKLNGTNNGLFTFEHSAVESMSNWAVAVTARRVTFSQNIFMDVLPLTFNIISDEFDFLHNKVGSSLKSDAFMVISERIRVSYNVFKNIHNKAFANIGSPIRPTSWYEFYGNTMELVGEGGLLPNLNTYGNISKQIRIKGNVFSCDCFLTGSLLSKIGNVTGKSATDKFYEKVIDEDSENVCLSSCHLPLSAAKGKYIKGKCMDNVTVENLCEINEKSTKLSPTSSHDDMSATVPSSFSSEGSSASTIINWKTPENNPSSASNSVNISNIPQTKMTPAFSTQLNPISSTQITATFAQNAISSDASSSIYSETSFARTQINSEYYTNYASNSGDTPTTPQAKPTMTFISKRNQISLNIPPYSSPFESSPYKTTQKQIPTTLNIELHLPQLEVKAVTEATPGNNIIFTSASQSSVSGNVSTAMHNNISQETFASTKATSPLTTVPPTKLVFGLSTKKARQDNSTSLGYKSSTAMPMEFKVSLGTTFNMCSYIIVVCVSWHYYLCQIIL